MNGAKVMPCNVYLKVPVDIASALVRVECILHDFGGLD